MGKKKKDESNLSDELKDSANRIWLAGLGALSMAESEGSKLFTTLVDKGRALDTGKTLGPKALKAKAGRLSRGAREKVELTAGDLEARVEKTVAKAMGKLGLASKDHVDALTRKVDELNALLAGSPGKRKTTRKKKPAAKKKTKRAAKKTPARKKAAKKKTTRRR